MRLLKSNSEATISYNRSCKKIDVSLPTRHITKNLFILSIISEKLTISWKVMQTPPIIDTSSNM